VRSNDAIRWATLALATGLFAVASSLTVAHGHGGHLEDGVEPIGWSMLVFGWMTGMLSFYGLLAWLANPLWILASVCLTYRRYPLASLCSAVGVGLTLIPLALLAESGMPALRFDDQVALVFHGGRLELRMGYFLWIGSSVVLLAGTSLTWWLERQCQKNNCA
jgi:hypothetical protein